MHVDVAFAQWQSVVSAVDPRLRETMVYGGSSPNVQSAGIVEVNLSAAFSIPLPTETEFLAAYPNAVKVGNVGP